MPNILFGFPKAPAMDKKHIVVKDIYAAMKMEWLYYNVAKHAHRQRVTKIIQVIRDPRSWASSFVKKRTTHDRKHPFYGKEYTFWDMWDLVTKEDSHSLRVKSYV